MQEWLALTQGQVVPAAQLCSIGNDRWLVSPMLCAMGSSCTTPAVTMNFTLPSLQAEREESPLNGHVECVESFWGNGVYFSMETMCKSEPKKQQEEADEKVHAGLVLRWSR